MCAELRPVVTLWQKISSRAWFKKPLRSSTSRKYQEFYSRYLQSRIEGYIHLSNSRSPRSSPSWDINSVMQCVLLYASSTYRSLFSSNSSKQTAVLQAQEVPRMPSHLLISTHPCLQLVNDDLQPLQKLLHCHPLRQLL